MTVKMRPLNGSLAMPFHYQYALQGLLYRSLREENFAHFLHDTGYYKGKRKFKLFTFSRLMGTHTIRRELKRIEFKNIITWRIGSVLEDVIQQLQERFMQDRLIQINGFPLIIESLELEEPRFNQSKHVIQMLSPITVYSTYEEQEKKKTNYFAPTDPAFPLLVSSNFSNKYEAYHGYAPRDEFIIRPLQVNDSHKVVTKFKNHIITGWLGKYELESSPEQIAFAHNAGIGSRNSQGFGMFEIV
ncbi:CRISPR-associated endoribonuclease Cas6 [Ectobacillus ponti]|uniref:CRISPR-associated endoribonuclease n=1 Tax=Ectobacillus ponti TaxID=2961894 RepID=A0AA41X2F3_9BACI|nr:CRISPR-associated endoribonuclease Cas6 [Ectobacillus ponti]MCP8967382.1 CRISPR-associated endoribonuclease Cas6 [Ectobacillus ponti]